MPENSTWSSPIASRPGGNPHPSPGLSRRNSLNSPLPKFAPSPLPILPIFGNSKGSSPNSSGPPSSPASAPLSALCPSIFFRISSPPLMRALALPIASTLPERAGTPSSLPSWCVSSPSSRSSATATCPNSSLNLQLKLLTPQPASPPSETPSPSRNKKSACLSSQIFHPACPEDLNTASCCHLFSSTGSLLPSVVSAPRWGQSFQKNKTTRLAPRRSDFFSLFSALYSVPFVSSRLDPRQPESAIHRWPLAPGLLFTSYIFPNPH